MARVKRSVGGKKHRRQVHDQRFGEKLLDKLLPHAPHNFPNPHFAGPFHRPGRGQVHIIDPGDQQYQDRHDGEKVDGFTIPVGFKLPDEIGVQVDVGDRHKVESHPGVVLLQLLARLAFHKRR